VVVYKKRMPPYTTSTEGVAAQRDFYSQPSDGVIGTLDDLITAFEGSTFNPFLDRARNLSAGAQLDGESAASAVVHLSVRAASLRGAFAHLAQKMLVRLNEVLNDSERVRAFTDIDSTDAKSLLSNAVREAFDKLSLTGLPLKDRLIFEKMACFRVREKFDLLMQEAAPLLSEQLLSMGGAVPSMAERGHTRALQNSLVPVARIDALRKLRWTVLAVELPDHFVLPDCAAVASSVAGQVQPVSMSTDEEISWVAMPISAKQVVIGYEGQDLPNLSGLNEHFAKCSMEFFVSSTHSADLEALAAAIGEAFKVLTNEVLADRFSAKRPERNDPVVAADVLNFQDVVVTFRSDTNRKTAVGKSIQQIFAQQCGVREAARLESIVVTNDVAQEVAGLLGRQLSSYEIAATKPGTVEIVPGTTPPTLRLILSESIGWLLLAGDVRLKRSATLLVKHLMGRLSYLDYWFGHLVPMADGRAFTVRQRISLELGSRFASHYYGAAQAALVAHESDLQDRAALSAHAITISLAALEAARLHFMSHKNVDTLLLDVGPALDMLLGTLAAYCAQHPPDAENRQLLDTSPVRAHLVRAGLWDWVRLFDQDLRRHYNSIASKSTSVDHVLAMSEHVERLLWHFGIFLSDTESGQMWIDICDHEQLAAVKQILNS